MEARFSNNISGFAYIASKLGGILQAATAINSMFGGPTFAVFILGFFFPWTEPIGVSIGYILGLANGIWVYLGSTQYPPYPEFTNELHTEIVGCKGLAIKTHKKLATFKGHS